MFANYCSNNTYFFKIAEKDNLQGITALFQTPDSLDLFILWSVWTIRRNI